MQQEKVTEILDVIDDVLRENDLPLVLPEYRAEYEDSKKEGNEAFIYGDIYYELEDALKEIPSKEERYQELLNKAIEGLGVGLNIPTLISDLLDLGFTPKELEEDFNFSKQDIQDGYRYSLFFRGMSDDDDFRLYEVAEDAIEHNRKD